MTQDSGRIFVIHPAVETWEGIYRMIASAAAKANVVAGRRSFPLAPEDRSGSSANVSEAISSASLVIADVSDSNPNVMYEVGFAKAERKPLLLIARSSRNVPFELSGLRVLIYDEAKPDEFVEHLTKAIRQALDSPLSFVGAATATPALVHRRVFISYSHSDREYLDRLLVHLKPLEREGFIDVWVDARLRPGDRWKVEIEAALERAIVAVLLISADFLASEFIAANELPPLLRAAEERGTRIIPLVLKPSRFARDPNLRHFQAVNDPREPLILQDHGRQEVLFDRVAEEIERVVKAG